VVTGQGRKTFAFVVRKGKNTEKYSDQNKKKAGKEGKATKIKPIKKRNPSKN